MTKKLKKKLNKIAIGLTATTLGAVTLGVIGVKLFVMQENNEYLLDTAVETNSKAEENIEIEIITGKKQANANIALTNTASDGAIICDSLVQGAKDNDLPDGDYTFRIVAGSETKDYAVELINFYDDVTYAPDAGKDTKTISLGDTSTSYKTLIVKYHKNLTIDKGVTVTATNVSELTYKKGMYLCVMGELTNNGEISMTKRGTYNLAGENVYLWKNEDGSFEYVPAVGGAGGAAVNSRSTGNWWAVSNGKAGTNGVNRATGGGGSGASANWSSSGNSGAGGAGTSYTGGRRPEVHNVEEQ